MKKLARRGRNLNRYIETPDAMTRVGQAITGIALRGLVLLIVHEAWRACV